MNIHPADLPQIPEHQLELAFQLSEYQDRIARVRRSMAASALDVLLVTHLPNACYLTGYQSPLTDWYVCIVLPLEGEAIAHVMEAEVGNLFLHGWSSPNVYGLPWWQEDSAAQELAEILNAWGYGSGTIGLELRRDGCRAHFADCLRAVMPQARFEDASDVVLDNRIVKSRAEIDHMRHAAAFSDIGVTAALNELSAGKTDGDISAAAYQAMLQAGSEYIPIQPLVYAGEAHRVPHLGAKRRAIRSGDTFSIELSGVYQRYGAPIFRTAVLGKPPELVKRLSDASLATLDLLFEMVEPGRSAADVSREMKSATQKMLEGLVPLRRMFGYSVGICFPPNWVEPSMVITESNERVLEPGMTFHSPAGYRRHDKGAGANFSETWVVTGTGAEPLTKAKRELLLLDA